MRGDENATNELKAPKDGGALLVIKKSIIISCKMEIKRIFSISKNQIVAGILEDVPSAQQQNIQKIYYLPGSTKKKK